MKESLILPAAAVAIIAAVVGLYVVVRLVWSEITGLGDEEEDDQAGSRTEERKNKRTTHEIEQWRNGK